MQLLAAIALALDLLDRVQHVIAVDARAAVALAHVMKLRVEAEAAGILLVAAPIASDANCCLLNQRLQLISSHCYNSG